MIFIEVPCVELQLFFVVELAKSCFFFYLPGKFINMFYNSLAGLAVLVCFFVIRNAT